MSRLFAVSSLLLISIVCGAQDRFADVEIQTVPVAGSVSILYGAGGNIGVSAGEDGILMIDDQFLPLAPKIREALSKLGGDSPKWLLNTHYHGDHTGGNPAFGEDSIIMAHDNVRVRLAGGEEDLPPHALPVVTFSDEASIFFNGEEIRLLHMPRGHTDGDAVVFFQTSNVVHMGDHFFRDRFPYVDLDAGGSVSGLTDNIERLLSTLDDDTRIIPGHGRLAEKADLERYHEMLVETTRIVAEHLDAGMTADEIVQSGLPETWESWGQGFINEERWIRTLVRDLESR